MKQGTIEAIVGFAVICVAAFFLVFSYRISHASKEGDGYLVIADFQNIDGLAEGNDVKLSGIKVGYIDSMTLEKDTYFATVKLRIQKDVELPSDSRASVSTSGLLGGKYIRITPGAADDFLKSGEKIKFTQSALNIEDLISKLAYSMTSK